MERNDGIKTDIQKGNLKFHNALCSPFRIHGLIFENGQFRRIPESVAKATSQGVYDLHKHTAGGRVRFRTNSSYVAIHATMPSIGKMAHFALTGSAGFDLYIRENEKERYYGTFMPPFRILNGYEGIMDFGTREMREITINFPLYSEVSNLWIGLEEDAQTEGPSSYAMETPIVYYGHSITQGGCASRPGNAYPSILSRKYHCEYINLGFSGSAKGEPEIARYISGLDMRLFVYDYDHNAPTEEHLEKTHEPMFRIIREANPDLPIVIMTATAMTHDTDTQLRRKQIIYRTYGNALARGDRNVYFLDGMTCFDECGDGATVEGCHPNDLGFAFIAKTLDKLLMDLI